MLTITFCLLQHAFPFKRAVFTFVVLCCIYVIPYMYSTYAFARPLPQQAVVGFPLHSYPSIFTRLSSCYNALFEIYINFIVFLGFSVDVQLDASAKRLALSCSESGAGAPAKHGCVFLFFFKRGQVAMHYNELNLSLSCAPPRTHTRTHTQLHIWNCNRPLNKNIKLLCRWRAEPWCIMYTSLILYYQGIK